MDPELIQAWVSTGMFIVAFALGIRSSYRLRRRYMKARRGIDPRNRLILFTIVVACWIIAATSGWIGTLSAIRLIFKVSIPWTPPITILFAAGVVLIPVMFDWAITRVANQEDDVEPK